MIYGLSSHINSDITFYITPVNFFMTYKLADLCVNDEQPYSARWKSITFMRLIKLAESQTHLYEHTPYMCALTL